MRNLCLGSRNDWHTRIKYDSDMPCVQMDFQFISGVGDWCTDAVAKATVLTMFDMDTGILLVPAESPDNCDEIDKRHCGQAEGRQRETVI